MAFESCYKAPVHDDYIVHGTRYAIAMASWTSASGEVAPLWFKIQDKDGEIHKITDFTVCQREKKQIYGQMYQIYYCKANVKYCPSDFRLFYCTDKTTWELVV